MRLNSYLIILFYQLEFTECQFDVIKMGPILCESIKLTIVRNNGVIIHHSFLKSLLASHGPNYLEKLFGPKVRAPYQCLRDGLTQCLTKSSLDLLVKCPVGKLGK